MVNLDGFSLSHVIGAIELPSQELVDNFSSLQTTLHSSSRQAVTMGAYGMPEIYTEANMLKKWP